jgi:preprotein translocase subunit Sec63
MPFLGGGSGGGPTPESPDAALFPIFMLSMLSLITIPATFYRCCCSPSSASDKAAAKLPVRKVADSTSEWGKQAAVQAAKLRPSFGKRVSNFMTAGNMSIVLGWVLMAVVVIYIQSL